MAKVPYSLAVGSLMYAMVATRPTIAFAVGVVSQFMENPSKKHWKAVKHILWYLKGVVSKSTQPASIVSYVDADYAGCVDNRRSTSGYVYIFARAAVSWRSSLQDCTSSFTMEAEYVALSDASKEAIWLSCLVKNLGIDKTLVIYCDSQSALALAKPRVSFQIETHQRHVSSCARFFGQEAH
ncbi:hypothetical protein L7F22_042673 [Adiantum nelumboides]|nr:hypothetical protein [Adiantum nelumboides]